MGAPRWWPLLTFPEPGEWCRPLASSPTAALLDPHSDRLCHDRGFPIIEKILYEDSQGLFWRWRERHSIPEIKLPTDPESIRAETDRKALETVRVTRYHVYLFRNLDRDEGYASIDARPRREGKCRSASVCGLVLETQTKLAGNEDRRCRWDISLREFFIQWATRMDSWKNHASPLELL